MVALAVIIFLIASSPDKVTPVIDNVAGSYSSVEFKGDKMLNPAALFIRPARALAFSESLRSFSGFPNYHLDFANSALSVPHILNSGNYYLICNGSLAQKGGKIYLVTAYHCIKYETDGIRGDSLHDVAFREVRFSGADREEILKIAPEIYDGPLLSDTRGSFSGVNFGTDQGNGKHTVFHSFSDQTVRLQKAIGKHPALYIIDVVIPDHAKYAVDGCSGSAMYNDAGQLIGVLYGTPVSGNERLIFSPISCSLDDRGILQLNKKYYEPADE